MKTILSSVARELFELLKGLKGLLIGGVIGLILGIILATIIGENFNASVNYIVKIVVVGAIFGWGVFGVIARQRKIKSYKKTYAFVGGILSGILGLYLTFFTGFGFGMGMLLSDLLFPILWFVEKYSLEFLDWPIFILTILLLFFGLGYLIGSFFNKK